MKHLDEIFKYAEQQYPREMCGLLVVKDGETEWLECENHAESPEDEFQFNSIEYIRASIDYDSIEAIVHSHPDGASDPSPHDIKSCNFLKIPYLIVSWPETSVTFVKPGEFS